MKFSDESTIAQINEILSKLSGVTSYRVNPVSGSVRVEFDPEKITRDQIRNRLLEK